jgi:hypothetical protein
LKERVIKKMSAITRFSVLIILCLLVTSLPSIGQGTLGSTSQQRALTVSHADIDPVSGDVLMISNSWREPQAYLRRYHPDGTPVSNFRLERFESCCALKPSLVAVAPDGSIFTLEYTGDFGGFFIYKHTNNGELDIDWGDREAPAEQINSGQSSGYSGGVVNNNGGYSSGQTSLLHNAGGGRFHYFFSDPIDIVPMEDGSLLVLDRIDRYVDKISPDGQTITQFIGQYGYIPLRPQRLLSDSEGYIYLVDYYDDFDLNRGGKIGVFRFNPDGTWISGWGEGSNGINDPWRPEMDFMTLVIEGNNNLIALGSGLSNINHGEVYVFDRETGTEVQSNMVDFRQGFDNTYVGIVGNPAGGFLVLDAIDFDVHLNYYDLDGTLASQGKITDLYLAE